jgi:fructose-1,6-bisphosphatase
MSPEIYLMTLFLPLATILLVFGMKYYAVVQQAKARTARDDADRRLADETVAQLAAIHAALAKLDARMGAVEKVLKEVG